MTRRHRVIVGSNKLDFDRNQWTQGHLNRTSLLESRLLSVVVNPEWRPPQRIIDEEFDTKMSLYPLALKNPLGYTKLILHRSNAIFMHDTNNRKLFKNRYRAYSHGCIRVDKAVELAKHLAQNFFKRRQQKDMNDTPKMLKHKWN